MYEKCGECGHCKVVAMYHMVINTLMFVSLDIGLLMSPSVPCSKQRKVTSSDGIGSLFYWQWGLIVVSAAGCTSSFCVGCNTMKHCNTLDRSNFFKQCWHSQLSKILMHSQLPSLEKTLLFHAGEWCSEQHRQLGSWGQGARVEDRHDHQVIVVTWHWY